MELLGNEQSKAYLNTVSRYKKEVSAHEYVAGVEVAESLRQHLVFQVQGQDCDQETRNLGNFPNLAERVRLVAPETFIEKFFCFYSESLVCA